jgi:hypothetical protein
LAEFFDGWQQRKAEGAVVLEAAQIFGQQWPAAPVRSTDPRQVSYDRLHQHRVGVEGLLEQRGLKGCGPRLLLARDQLLELTRLRP